MISISNILSKDTLVKIQKHNTDIFTSANLVTSTTFWGQNIIEYSKDVLIYELPKESKEFELLKSDINLVNNKNRIESILYYYWKPGSYIPWHSDSIYSSALTIYLNKEWNYNWGGLFQYFDGDDIISVTPKYNMGVYQESTLPHSTTITNKDTAIRKTIQVFFNKEKVKPTSII